MLTRAVSAPAKYGGPGILRYDSYSFDSETNSPVSVSFAPLPVPDPDPGSRRHKYKMGVQGRTGILSKQRQHPNGINYRPPSGGEMVLSSTAAAATRQKAKSSSPPIGTPANDKREALSEGSKSFDTSGSGLSLRRASSEDGTANTLSVANKGGSSFKFWRKTFHPTSKPPGLSTVPSEDTQPDAPVQINDNATGPIVGLEGTDGAVFVDKENPEENNIREEPLDAEHAEVRSSSPSSNGSEAANTTANSELGEKVVLNSALPFKT